MRRVLGGRALVLNERDLRGRCEGRREQMRSLHELVASTL
jgi:hypothetical protein